jgi:hypothetical protein
VGREKKVTLSLPSQVCIMCREHKEYDNRGHYDHYYSKRGQSSRGLFNPHNRMRIDPALPLF